MTHTTIVSRRGLVMAAGACLLLLLTAVLLLLAAAQRDNAAAARQQAQVFVARSARGVEAARGPLRKMSDGWAVTLGGPGGRRIDGDDLIELRQPKVALPPLPSVPHLLLAGGDRIPYRSLRLKDEKLSFTHRDLNDNKEVSVPLSSVVLIWRVAPDGAVAPERARRRLAARSLPRDVVLLRNGDTVEGTLESLSEESVSVDANKKLQSAKWPQVAAVTMSSELSERAPAKGLRARVVLTATESSPGGRITLVSATSDGETLTGKTAFGATLSVPLARVVGLEMIGGKAVPLSSLKPQRYEYKPYLDERWPWSADAAVTGRDLSVGGSAYDSGVGTHASSVLTYGLGEGAYRRFEAVVGLDDADGVRGRARVRVKVDGKAAELPGKGELTHAAGPLAVSVSLPQGAKELALEVEASAEDGPVQAVVNWAAARLVK